jgi:pimeloyl-ACP methyl ester carboxylesterase
MAAQAVFIPKAGHLSNLEAPLAFNEALTAFLSQL